MLSATNNMFGNFFLLQRLNERLRKEARSPERNTALTPSDFHFSMFCPSCVSAAVKFLVVPDVEDGG